MPLNEEREPAQQALERSEERHRLVAGVTREVIWDADLLTGLTSWSGAVRDVFGMQHDLVDIDFEWWRARIHPADVPDVLAARDAALRSPSGRYGIEYRLRHEAGRYVIVSARGQVLRDAEGVAVRFLGSMLDVTDFRRQEEELNFARRVAEKANDAKSELLRRLVVAQEDERARIAADVHDDSVQSIAVLDLRLGSLERRLGDSAPDLVPSINELRAAVRDVSRGLRDLLFELEPAHSGADLTETLRSATAQIFEEVDLDWTVGFDEGAGPMPVDWPNDVARAQILRIVKEALINVRKHAAATRVDVVIRRVDGGVEIVVADDGVGPAGTQSPPRPGHRGLATMRDRAEIAGGWCTVEATSPGTVVRLWLPSTSPGPAGSS
nr:PAS domain-containing protein [Nocardioides luti]